MLTMSGPAILRTARAMLLHRWSSAFLLLVLTALPAGCSRDAQTATGASFQGRDGTRRVIEPVRVLRFTSAVHSLAFSPDTSTLAVGTHRTLHRTSSHPPTEDEITFWDIKTGKQGPTKLGMVRTSPGLAKYPLAIAFAPDGSRVASCTQSRADLWEYPSGRLLKSLETRTRTVAFSPDSRLLVRAGDDGLSLLDAQTPAEPRVLIEPGQGSAYAVAFNSSSTLLAAASQNAGTTSTILLIDPADGSVRQKVESLPLISGVVNRLNLRFTPGDGELLACGGTGFLVRHPMEGETLKPPAVRTPLVGSSGASAISPRGDLIAVVEDARVAIHDSSDGARLATVNVTQGAERGSWFTQALVFSPDGTHLACARYNGSTQGAGRVSIWRITP